MYLKFHTEGGSGYMGFKAKYSIGNTYIFLIRKEVIQGSTTGLTRGALQV
jgi:hypothetical protein